MATGSSETRWPAWGHTSGVRVDERDCGWRASRTHGLRAVIDDVSEEGLDEELTRGQSFDDTHGRATARHGHERVGVAPTDGAVTGDGEATARTVRHIARSWVRHRGASRPK